MVAAIYDTSTEMNPISWSAVKSIDVGGLAAYRRVDGICAERQQLSVVAEGAEVAAYVVDLRQVVSRAKYFVRERRRPVALECRQFAGWHRPALERVLAAGRRALATSLLADVVDGRGVAVEERADAARVKPVAEEVKSRLAGLEGVDQVEEEDFTRVAVNM